MRVWIQWGDNPQQIQELFDKYTAETGIKVALSGTGGDDGVVRAFANVCLHRGVEVGLDTDPSLAIQAAGAREAFAEQGVSLDDLIVTYFTASARTATLPPAIRRIARHHLREPEHVVVQTQTLTVASTEQRVAIVVRDGRLEIFPIGIRKVSHDDGRLPDYAPIEPPILIVVARA